MDGQGRTKTGYRMGNPSLPELEHIHIAFADDRAPIAADGFLGQMQTLQDLRFVKQGRLATVFILRLLVAEGATPKGYRSPMHIEDGNHHSRVEKIIGLVIVL